MVVFVAPLSLMFNDVSAIEVLQLLVLQRPDSKVKTGHGI